MTTATNTVPKIQHQANVIARRAGFGTATRIIHDSRFRPGTGIVESHEDYGYYKNTTGERVPNSYRNHFGWKNTYYQPAKTVVRMNTSF